MKLLTISVIAAIVVSVQAATPTTQPERVTIRQRQAKVIPGTDGKLHLRLDDITGGQVRVTVERDGEPRATVVGETSVKEGDVLPIDAGGLRVEVIVVELVNAAMGDDYGVFE